MTTQSNATSFQKKSKAKTLLIPGTKPSFYNNQLLTSTGIPSFDGVTGGGLAVGTVLLVEEDTYGSFSHTLLKYFLAEGVLHQHHVLVSSAKSQPDNILKELPRPIVDDPADSSNTGSGGDMTIAWRYHNLPQVQSSTSTNTKFGHYFDMTKIMDEERLSKAPTTKVFIGNKNNSQQNCFISSSYGELLSSIQDTVSKGQFSTDLPPQVHKNILRIGIEGLGGPLWEDNNNQNSDTSLCRFLYALRGILRHAYAVCLITMPTHLFQDTALLSRVRHLCDTVVHLDSFAGSDKETNPVYKEYHGLFNLIKLPRLNSLTCHMPDTLDLAFKLRRKKFMIEKLHLPPELSDTTGRSQEDPDKSLCNSSSGKNKLDF